MRKKLFLGTILMLSLVLIVAAISVIPAIANSTSSNSTTKYGTVGEVTLQLPPPGGAISHPTNLKFDVFDYSKRSNSADAIQILIWVSAMNNYVPVAFISDQPWSAQDKANLNNTAMYLEVNGVVIRNNLKTVADKELEIWTETPSSQYGHGRWGIDEGGRWYWWNAPGGETLIANLTAPVQLDFTGLPPIFGSSFTVPDAYMKFIGIAQGFDESQLNSQLPSGVKVSVKGTNVPAWALVRISSWGIDQSFAGSIYENFVITFTPPT